ncbi:hypothetical protein H310_07413 [Aphanomyces invadans]|uniref:Uncharacterized protein n=1 Tax=Aphanomyces invadans TaxID=157072 RepID=A0A024U144_9STRA|nr:hypothetical protein H310_07413 [Aphanomyces invadans]ETV99958.1 hypothetical protein H310_07413 [Aphanomyces invadans]|eukprot:XP_008871376.1 hypothetical protein H310_07413 [Aphanomyces invadans]
MADDTSAVLARRKSPGRPAFKYGRKSMPKQFKNKIVDYKHRLEAIIKVSEIGNGQQRVYELAEEEESGDVGVLDDSTLGELFTIMAIEDTIHPDQDIDCFDEADSSEPN